MENYRVYNFFHARNECPALKAYFEEDYIVFDCQNGIFLSKLVSNMESNIDMKRIECLWI